jgi:hypothetical protein
MIPQGYPLYAVTRAGDRYLVIGWRESTAEQGQAPPEFSPMVVHDGAYADRAPLEMFHGDVTYQVPDSARELAAGVAEMLDQIEPYIDGTPVKVIDQLAYLRQVIAGYTS